MYTSPYDCLLDPTQPLTNSTIEIVLDFTDVSTDTTEMLAQAHMILVTPYTINGKQISTLQYNVPKQILLPNPGAAQMIQDFSTRKNLVDDEKSLRTVFLYPDKDTGKPVLLLFPTMHVYSVENNLTCTATVEKARPIISHTIVAQEIRRLNSKAQKHLYDKVRAYHHYALSFCNSRARGTQGGN